MARETRLIEPDNQQTLIAVAFVLALLSLAFNFYNYQTLTRAAMFLSSLDLAEFKRSQQQAQDANAEIDALQAEVAALRARLDTLEQAAGAPPP